MPRIDHVIKNISNRGTAPSVRPLHIHSRMALSILPVIVMGECQDLFVFQNTGNLTGAFSSGAQLEDILHDHRGCFVGDDVLSVGTFLLVPIGNFYFMFTSLACEHLQFNLSQLLGKSPP